MKATTHAILWAMILMAFSWGCKSTQQTATTKAKAYSPVGSWAYEVKNTPNGNYSGTLELAKTDEGYKAIMNSSQGVTEVKNLVVADNTMTGQFSAEGYEAAMKGLFEGDSFEGMVDVAGYSFPITMTRKPTP